VAPSESEYDVYRIKTEVTEAGGKAEKGYYVDKRSKESRAFDKLRPSEREPESRVIL
jgi:hypothetical protein